MSPEWLLADGEPFVDALVLSHPEQFERLRTACPEAFPYAVLGGDPCFDRMLAALPRRERFRRAFGVRPGQRLILLNSTWNPESLFGNGGGEDVLPLLLPRLIAELPADEYRTAAVLHPNIWHGHGAGQVRSWLDRAGRAGTTLVDPVEDWRQALIAADAVIGDYGSVSYYAAALGTPVLLGSAALSGLDPESPVGRFARQAPQLDPYKPLRAQLEALFAEHRPLSDPAELTSSVPGQSAALLRRAFYRLLGMPEPEQPALLEPLPLPEYRPSVGTLPLQVVTLLLGPAEVAVRRYADSGAPPPDPGAVHTAVHEDTRDLGVLALADVVFRHGDPADVRFGSPEEWTAEVLARHRDCGLAAYVTGPGRCTVRARDGRAARLDGSPTAEDPAAWASALYAYLDAGGTWSGLGAGLTVRGGGDGGGGRHTVRVTVTG